ncbi:MAG: AAA family ATPase [Rhodospirillales bacterium]
MFQEHFGISENPFANTPDPDFLFMSSRHKEALAHLVYGVNGESGFVLLTGEIGTGKTTLCRYLAENMPDGVELALCINPRRSEVELLDSICDEMGITVHGDRSKVKDLTDSINAYLLDVHARGDHAVLMIDEAQNLGFEQLEQVRLLTNLETAERKLLQIILVGQPELRDRIAESDLVQLSQRITARYHLTPMERDEAEAYILHRLDVAGLSEDIFDKEAIALIYRASGGVPRLINSICERCLLGAYANGTKTIDANLAMRSADEVLGKPVQPDRPAPRRRLWLAACAAMVLVGAFVTLDPLRWSLVPGLSESPAIKTARDEIREWPLVGSLFRPEPGR